MKQNFIHHVQLFIRQINRGQITTTDKNCTGFVTQR